MKPCLRHIVAISLSALVLLSTLSFSVDLHYCGKKLVAIALNNKAQGCGMEIPSDKTYTSGDQIGKHCCEDVMLAFEGHEDLQYSGYEFSAAKFFATHVVGFSDMVPRLEIINRDFHFREYSPPLLIRDIPVFNQTFLI